MLQSDWLLKCKDIVIMTIRGARTIFLDTRYATIKKTQCYKTMVCVLLRETVSLLTSSLNVISVNFIACFWIIFWFLQTLNYKGNEKYVLVLVQCHDAIITNSINLVCFLHSSIIRARPYRFISFVIIAS